MLPRMPLYNPYLHPLPYNPYHSVMGNQHYMPYAFPPPVPPVASVPVLAVTNNYHGNVTINNHNDNVLPVHNPYKN